MLYFYYFYSRRFIIIYFITGMSTFPFYSRFLSSIGMVEQYQQYGLYGTTLLAVSQSIQPMKKAFWLHKYVHEKDESMRKIWAGRGNLSTSEKEVSELLLIHYKNVPRRWAMLPITFVVFELTKALYFRFTSFQK